LAIKVNVNIKGRKSRTLLHLACINNLQHSKDSEKIKAGYDTILCQMVEVIVERCVQQVLDETTKNQKQNTL